MHECIVILVGKILWFNFETIKSTKFCPSKLTILYTNGQMNMLYFNGLTIPDIMIISGVHVNVNQQVILCSKFKGVNFVRQPTCVQTGNTAPQISFT